MLRAKGIAWSPKRIEALLCAFDEDGDGALDLAEFANGLEQLAAVAGIVLEEQQPSQPAVAAGVVAVGSRLDKNNYVEEMAAWARDSQQLLPKAVLLQANIAAVQAIGPAYLQAHLEQQQIDELTKAVEALEEMNREFEEPGPDLSPLSSRENSPKGLRSGQTPAYGASLAEQRRMDAAAQRDLEISRAGGDDAEAATVRYEQWAAERGADFMMRQAHKALAEMDREFEEHDHD